MQENYKPKNIEKRLIYLQSRDGVLDIFFGCMLMAAALSDTFTYYNWAEPWYIRFMIIILMVPFLLVKVFLTTPRIGYVKMKPVAGGRKQLLILLTIFGIVLTTLLLAATLLKGPLLSNHEFSLSPVVEFAFWIFLFGFIGWLMGLYSLIAVGLIFGFAWPIAGMIGLDSIASLPAELFTVGLPGFVIAGIGIIRLIKFLRMFPRQNLKANFEHGEQ
ncbi:MAG TPA: hypothetical protein DC042_00295 [Bacteroidales bacterium]|nr:hypothetical protein [Bacteroidales bacterium]